MRMAMTDSPGIPNRAMPSEPAADSKRTWVRLTMGIVSVVLGIVVIVLPEKTLAVVAVVFGIQLVILGLVRAALALTVAGLPRWVRVLSVLLGALTVVAGVLCFTRPRASLVVIAILLAAGWIADGIADLSRGIGRDRTAGEVTYLVVSGAVSILAGLVVIIAPETSLEVLTQVGGVALLLIGAVTCLSVVLSRRRRRR
jgi:uncharacterized membrane protein HdeD (DUF308 family)